jgi:hypothetical protein
MLRPSASLRPVLVVVLLVMAGACRVSRARVGTAELPATLFVPGDAVDVTTTTATDGMVEVTYKISEQYPATGLLAKVHAAVPAAWKPLERDWLNRRQEASHSAGWIQFADATNITPRFVHQWSAQWLDASGNVTAYQLRYESQARRTSDPMAPPENRTVLVTALWVPARAAIRLMDGSHAGPMPARPAATR